MDLNIETESIAYINLYKCLLENVTSKPIKIYSKGGAIIGIKILQDFFTHIFNKSGPTGENLLLMQNIIKKYIKDIDFTVISEKLLVVNETEPKSVNFNPDICKDLTSDFRLEGQTILVVRYKNKIMVGDDAYYETSYKNELKLSENEIPLTSFKIEITLDNVLLFFEMTKNIYNWSKINEESEKLFDFLKANINKFTVNIPDCMNGLFNIGSQPIDGLQLLGEDMVSLIDSLSLSHNEKQFLTSHILEPDRLFIRFLGKNFKKSKEIYELYTSNGIDISSYNWLFTDADNTRLRNIINIFTSKLKNKMSSLIDESKLDYLYTSKKELNNTKVDESIRNELKDKLMTEFHLNKKTFLIDYEEKIKSNKKKLMSDFESLFQNSNIARVNDKKLEAHKIPLVQSTFDIFSHLNKNNIEKLKKEATKSFDAIIQLYIKWKQMSPSAMKKYLKYKQKYLTLQKLISSFNF
jgi:hypothetical protein